MNTISVEELEKIDSSKITIVDVRPADQYSRGSFPGAVNIPLDEFEERMESVDREKMVYVLCHTGDRSRDCVEKLSDAGYEAVNIEGGYRAYLRLSLSRFMENDAKEQKELKTKEIEHSIIKTFRKTVWRPFTKALNQYQLIQEGDKIAVCISGGKDSMLMAKLLQELKRHGKIHFELVFLVMNPGYNADNWKIIQDNAELLGIPLTVFESDIFEAERIRVELVKLITSMHPELLLSAYELGITKIVLPEFDEMVETEQLNPHHVYNVGEHSVRAVAAIRELVKDKPEIDDKTFMILCLTMLLHDSGKPATRTLDETGRDHFHGHQAVSEKIAKRVLKGLKFDNYTIDTVTKLVRHHDDRIQTTPLAMREATHVIGKELMPLFFIIQRADVMAQKPETQKEKLAKLQVLEALFLELMEKQYCVQLKELAINGKELIRIGYQPGKEMGSVLNILLQKVIEKPELNNTEILTDLALAMLSQ